MPDLMANAGDVADDDLDTVNAGGAALPPPPPPSLDAPTRTNAPRILAVVAGVALLAAVVMGLFWMSASSARSDAEAERDDALIRAERTAELEGQLATTTADQEAAAATNLQLQSDLDAALAAASEAKRETEEASADLDVVRDEAADASADNQALSDEIATLKAELVAAEEAVTASAADAPADAAAEPAAFDISSTPDFARYIGESLSSRSGSSRLSQAQSTCFGTAIVNDIGLDALGKGLILPATSQDNNAVVGAMQRAAGTCDIDLGLIF